MNVEPERDPENRAAEDLLEASAGEGQGPPGSVRSALANAMVGMKKKYYGKGPTAARAWVLDDYVFVVLEGGLTPNEETLLNNGKVDLVRQYRLAFEEVVGDQLMQAVADIVDRPVLTYHSQIVFDPVRTFEVFVLG
jgi:uncharacterized protein YbcI